MNVPACRLSNKMNTRTTGQNPSSRIISVPFYVNVSLSKSCHSFYNILEITNRYSLALATAVITVNSFRTFLSISHFQILCPSLYNCPEMTLVYNAGNGSSTITYISMWPFLCCYCSVGLDHERRDHCRYCLSSMFQPAPNHQDTYTCLLYTSPSPRD